MNGYDVVIAAVGVGGFLFILWLVVRLVNNRAATTSTTTTTTGTGAGAGTTGGTPPPPPPPPPPPGTGITPPPPTTTTVVVTPPPVAPPPTTPVTPDPAMPPNEVLAMLRESNGRVSNLTLITDNQRGYSKLEVELLNSKDMLTAAEKTDLTVTTASGGTLTSHQRPPTRDQLREAGERALARLNALDNAPA